MSGYPNLCNQLSHTYYENMKTLFFTKIANLRIIDLRDKEIEIFPGLKLTNDFKKIDKYLNQNFIKLIGLIDYEDLRGSDAFFLLYI